MDVWITCCANNPVALITTDATDMELTYCVGKVKVKVVKITLRPTVSRSVCLAVRHPSETNDQFFFFL
jgi:hypothetical protein